MKIVMPMMMAKAGGGTLRSRMRKEVLTGWCSEENEIGGTDMVVL